MDGVQSTLKLLICCGINKFFKEIVNWNMKLWRKELYSANQIKQEGEEFCKNKTRSSSSTNQYLENHWYGWNMNKVKLCNQSIKYLTLHSTYLQGWNISHDDIQGAQKFYYSILIDKQDWTDNRQEYLRNTAWVWVHYIKLVMLRI